MFGRLNPQNLKWIIILVFTLSNINVVLSQNPDFNDEFKILVNGNKTGIAEVLSQYIQIESISCNEKEAGTWLRNVCEENGLHILQMGEENCNFNFAASVYPLSDTLPNIIFLNHIDVVPPGDSALWTYPPFSGEITDKDVWGRGAFDNKGNAIMQLYSVIQFLKENKGIDKLFNITFLSVSCEEILCEGGVGFVVDNFLEILNPAVIIGEGASEISESVNAANGKKIFAISYAHKTPLWLELKLTIATLGHGSIAPLEYANKEMIISLNRLVRKKARPVYNKMNKDILRQLGKTKKGMEKFLLSHPVIFRPLLIPHLRSEPALFALFSNTLTVTNINSNNDFINTIPKSVTALIDCRLLPGESEEVFLNKLRKKIKNDEIEINVRNTIPEMYKSDIKSTFYSKMEKAVQEIYPQSMVLPIFLPNYSDVGLFRSKKIQCFSINPIIMGNEYLENIHNQNERIPVNSLSMGKNTYLKFIQNCITTKMPK